MYSVEIVQSSPSYEITIGHKKQSEVTVNVVAQPTIELLSYIKYLKGDKGDEGDKGDKGDTGDKGDKGDTLNVALKTDTKLIVTNGKATLTSIPLGDLLFGIAIVYDHDNYVTEYDEVTVIGNEVILPDVQDGYRCTVSYIHAVD